MIPLPGFVALIRIKELQNNPRVKHKTPTKEKCSPRGLSTFVTDLMVMTWVVLLAPLSKFETQVSRGSEKSLSRLGSPARCACVRDERCTLRFFVSLKNLRRRTRSCCDEHGNLSVEEGLGPRTLQSELTENRTACTRTRGSRARAGHQSNSPIECQRGRTGNLCCSTVDSRRRDKKNARVAATPALKNGIMKKSKDH